MVDPCDDWPVEIWKGHLCLVTEREHGVSPLLGYWSKGWRYEVVETSFIPYGVFIETVMIPIYAEDQPHDWGDPNNMPLSPSLRIKDGSVQFHG